MPLIPTGGLLLWLRADAGIVETNGRITTWRDQSGRGAHATQSAPEWRPTLEVDAAGGLGDLPTVLFDGVDDYLDLPSGFSDFSKGLTIFAVADSRPNDACPGIFEASTGPELDDIHLGRHEGQLQYEVLAHVFRGGTFLPDVRRRLSLVHRPSTAVELRQSGAALAETFIELPAVVERPFSFVGRTLYQACSTWDGHIGELLVYDHALNDTDFATVDGYLAARWDQAAGLPLSR